MRHHYHVKLEFSASSTDGNMDMTFQSLSGFFWSEIESAINTIFTYGGEARLAMRYSHKYRPTQSIHQPDYISTDISMNGNAGCYVMFASTDDLLLINPDERSLGVRYEQFEVSGENKKHPHKIQIDGFQDSWFDTKYIITNPAFAINKFKQLYDYFYFHDNWLNDFSA